MKTRTWLALGLAAAVAAPAFAGGDHKKCTQDKAACIESMKASYASKGWSGFEADKSSGALVIKAVTPGSPAEAAGIRAGDTLVALNGVRFADADKDALYAAKKALVPGATAKYTLERAGEQKTVAVQLIPVPNVVLAKWIDAHVAKDHNKGL